MKNKSEVEHSLITKYRKDIWRKFMKAVRDYELVSENDHIAVCISGGKDSVILAKCLEELARHGKTNFKLSYIVMNPGYKEETLKVIKENLESLGIDYKIFDSDIFEVANKLDKDHPCYMCARMRRGFLYKTAKDLGCNKIALGHHFDDVIETNLLSMFYGAEIKTMLPKLHSEHFKGLELIRPMYLIKEQDIISWAKYNHLSFLNCACKMTLENSLDEEKSKRKEIKKLINDLRKINPYIDYNIFKSMENINLTQILGYKKEEEKYFFLEDYDEKGCPK